MTDSKQSASRRSADEAILDPQWEETLRRGQEAEGENGSVEAELAFVHLLRHAREPEALAPEQLDAIWSAIEAEVAPAGVPGWRKAWVWWSAPALAAAAVLMVVVLGPGKDEATVALQESKQSEKQDERAEQQNAAPAPAAIDGARGGGEPLAAEAELAEESLKKSAADEGFASGSGSMGAADSKAVAKGGSSFEMSFAKLAPHGRLAIRVGVDQSRDELRSQLLATARGGGR